MPSSRLPTLARFERAAVAAVDRRTIMRQELFIRRAQFNDTLKNRRKL
jgi:hypothetical protein